MLFRSATFGRTSWVLLKSATCSVRLSSVQVLIHGGNQFLGSDVEDWARELGIDVVRYPPNWQRHGKQAERQRNHFMLTDSHPDVVIALPGGDDTCELVCQAKASGISVLTVES